MSKEQTEAQESSTPEAATEAEWFDVEIVFTETWRRKNILKINRAEVEDWQKAPATMEVVQRFLDAGFEMSEWHPGTEPDGNVDEFIDAEIDGVYEVAVAASSVDMPESSITSAVPVGGNQP